MKVGLFVMPIHPPGRTLSESFDQDLKAIRMADRLGFSEAWVGEHMTFSGALYSPGIG